MKNYFKVVSLSAICAFAFLPLQAGAQPNDEWNGKQPPKDARGLMVCRPDGRRRAVFESPWWRSGRWCQLDVSTADDPLEITSVRIFETGYPMEDAGRFESDDPTLEDVRKLCLRGLRSCMHETFIDCPYWERQNYPGDMRVEMLAAFARRAGKY